jgi:hypothetical protein
MAKRQVRRKIPDTNLYDSQESDKYVQGYAIGFAVPSIAANYLGFQRMIHDKELNAYAYIPTDIPTSEREASVLAYILFKTEFEFKMAVHELSKCYTRRKWHLSFAVQSDKPVWFHKSWCLKSYDPKLYDTGAKQFVRVSPIHEKYTIFSKKEFAEMRKDFCFSQKCYAPTSEDCDICKNYMRDVTNDKLCFYCAAGKKRGKILTSNGALIYDPESDTIKE